MAFYDTVYAAEGRRAATFRRARELLHLTRPPRILPYRGYGTTARVSVRARVLEHRPVRPLAERKTFLHSAYASYQRYATREIAGVAVELRWAGRTWAADANDEGFVEIIADPPEVRGGWHDVELSLVHDPRTRCQAHVFVIDASTEYGVISDVDDTVIATSVTHPLRRAHALFLSEARHRLPFEGVAAFYRALHEGIVHGQTNPIFYVSSSPWNMYEHIDEFLDLHDIPYGPVLLRDWGFSRHNFAPNGKHEHKLERIREVLELTAPLRFILIGDSGQEDPELYARVAEEAPGRVACIYIRRASTRRGRGTEVEAIGERVRARGVEFLAVDDTVAAARHAAAHGFILGQEVEHVAAEKEDMDAKA